MEKRIQLLKGNICLLKVDAIVNAANNSLLGGGGVDGAIHQAAGTELLDECRKLNGCLTGQAKITKAYKFSAKYIIHTVGPIWDGGTGNENDLLASCYKESLKIATNQKLHHVAFPNISTGAYRFPKNKAAEIAIETVKNYLAQNNMPETVFFVCFDEENYNIYKQMLSEN
jgi:O-acetyl-ADP-ribose deacetylase (regulator of RNase III)